MKLAIGTAQFGLDYGISNQEGQTSVEEVVKILDIAAQNGIQVLDTAPVYGTSEEVLGKTVLCQHNFKIITKTPKFSKTCITSNEVQVLEDTFYQSLSRLQQPYVYGLLVHHANDLLVENGQYLMEKMLKLKQKKLIKKIGVSVYTDTEIDEILDKYSIDLIQVPINILDQRLLVSGHLKKLKEKGIEIHARSLFLQGLILTNPEYLPSYFNFVKNHLQFYHNTLSKSGISSLQGAISFVKSLEIDCALVGINNCHQLREIISIFNNKTNFHLKDFSNFALTDSLVLNPSNWKL